jgi:ubiquinone/menaquinone biosynthesis C-methylase UbiE
MDHLLLATAKAESAHFWFRGFRRFVRPLLRRAAAGRPGLQLLDCGCGTGNNLDLLGEFGRSFGFDLTEVGLALGRRAGRTRLTRASIAAIPFPDNSFDIVTTFDVIYSLPTREEQAAAAEMYRVLKPGGFLIVNVAAMESLKGNHSVLSRELRRYSRRSLAALLSHAGFSIDRLTYTNATILPAVMLARGVQRRRGLRAESEADQDFHLPHPVVNAVLAAALTVESWWLRVGTSPFGSSLLCLARKPG